MEDKSIQYVMNGNITQPDIIWNHHSDCNIDDPTITNQHVEKRFPVANEGLLEAASTPDGKNVCKNILNSVFNEPHTTKAQPFVSKISNGKHKFLQNGNLKRKRNIYTLDLSVNNLEDFKQSPVESPASPSFPKCASMVTTLKYQNGDFVEVQSSSSMYNSPMSLRDMRNAIIASLESYINQPGTDLPSHCGGLWSANSITQQTSPKVKDCGENAETSKKGTELSKQRKPSSSHVEVKRVYNPPDDESIKFANRQKELMRIKKELKKKIKMETSEDVDPSNPKIRSNWGRSVGVMCTMCGKHVQKSYGCFRRESAPEKLVHLFTPGMNRIKICRRCLPYKKQSGSGEDNKKTGRKSGEKILGNDSRKIENVVNHIANRDTSIMKTETTNDKPVSTATLDAIHRKLNAANVATNAIFNPPSKIVLNESAKGEAMEYIKKLAENLKANYSQEAGTPTVQNKTPFSQQHPSSKNPETPSANQIETSLVSERTCEKTGTNQVITGRWAPVMVNHGSSTVTPPPNVVQPIVRPITKQKECAFRLISAPSCASLGANPTPSQTIASSLALGSLLETRTTDAVQNCGKSSGNEAQAIPAIVVSTQNSVSGQASVLLQIQPVKLVSKKVEENKEAKTKLKGDEETTGGKNKRSRASSHRPVVCVSCKTNVVKSYRCINQSLSPPKLQHLFSNDTEVLRVCRKCLFKDGTPQHKTDRKGKVDDIPNEVMDGAVGGERVEDHKDEGCPRIFKDQARKREKDHVNVPDENLVCAPKNDYKNAEPENGYSKNNSSNENLDNSGTPRDTRGYGDGESTTDCNYGNIESMDSTGAPRDCVETEGTLPDYDRNVERVQPAETSPGNNESTSLQEIIKKDSEEVRPRDSLATLGVFNKDHQNEVAVGEDDVVESVVTIGTATDGDENFELNAVRVSQVEEVDPEDCGVVTGISKEEEEMSGSNQQPGAFLKNVENQAKTEELGQNSGASEEIEMVFNERTPRLPLANEKTIQVVGSEIYKGNTECARQVGNLYEETESGGITPNNKVGDKEEVRKEFLSEETKGISCAVEDIQSESKYELQIHYSDDREREEKDNRCTILAKETKMVGSEGQSSFSSAENCEAKVRNEEDLGIHNETETEKILEWHKANDVAKQSKIKENGKVNSEKKVKSTSPKSASTENNAVKDSDKKLRKRRVVGGPRSSPAKNEKKIEAEWHDKTRGALLKKQKEAESSCETTQGVKRKIEKRQCRGKKARIDEVGNKSSLEETKISKQEQQLTKDVKSSLSKRMKARKE